MNKNESDLIAQVYKKFADSENDRGWTKLDDALEHLQWLDDQQISREAEVQFSYHSMGKIRCRANHTKSVCFAPKIVQAAQVIIDLYRKTGHMNTSGRYVLEYYLAFSNLNIIFVEE